MFIRPQQYLLHDHWLFIFISHISINSAHILIYMDFDFYFFIVLGRLLRWVLAFFQNISNEVCTGFLCVMENLENCNFIFQVWRTHGI